MRRIYGIIVVLFVLVFGALSALVFLLARPETAPILFPLDDPRGRYRVQMLAGNYAIAYQAAHRSVTDVVLIGTSTPDLRSFMGKWVRIAGSFAAYSTNRQCIAGHCHLLFGDPRDHAVVVNLTAIHDDTRK